MVQDTKAPVLDSGTHRGRRQNDTRCTSPLSCPPFFFFSWCELASTVYECHPGGRFSKINFATTKRVPLLLPNECVFGKLSARCFQTPIVLAPMLFQLWRYRPGGIDPGVCVIYTVVHGSRTMLRLRMAFRMHNLFRPVVRTLNERTRYLQIHNTLRWYVTAVWVCFVFASFPMAQPLLTIP